eukprot:Opistho-2@69912
MDAQMDDTSDNAAAALFQELFNIPHVSPHQRESMSYVLWRRSQCHLVKKFAFSSTASSSEYGLSRPGCIARSLAPSHDVKTLHNAARIVAELCFEPSPPSSAVEYRREGCRDVPSASDCAASLLSEDDALRLRTRGVSSTAPESVPLHHNASALFGDAPSLDDGESVWMALSALLGHATDTIARAPIGRTVSYTSRLWQQLSTLCAEASLAIVVALSADIVASNLAALDAMRGVVRHSLETFLGRPELVDPAVILRLVQLDGRLSSVLHDKSVGRDATAWAAGVVLQRVVDRAPSGVLLAAHVPESVLGTAAVLLRLLRQRRSGGYGSAIHEHIVGADMRGPLVLLLESSYVSVESMGVSRVGQSLLADAEIVLCRDLLEHGHIPSLLAGTERYAAMLASDYAQNARASGMFRFCLNTLAKYTLFRGNDGAKGESNSAACMQLLASIVDRAEKYEQGYERRKLSTSFESNSSDSGGADLARIASIWEHPGRGARPSVVRACVKVIVSHYSQPHNALRFRELFRLALGVEGALSLPTPTRASLNPPPHDAREVLSVSPSRRAVGLRASVDRPTSTRRRILPPILSAVPDQDAVSNDACRHGSVEADPTVGPMPQLSAPASAFLKTTKCTLPLLAVAASFVASLGSVYEASLWGQSEGCATASMCAATLLRSQWVSRSLLSSLDTDRLAQVRDVLMDAAADVEDDLRGILSIAALPPPGAPLLDDLHSIVSSTLLTVSKVRSQRLLLSRGGMLRKGAVDMFAGVPSPPSMPRPPRRPASRAELRSASRSRTMTGPAGLVSVDMSGLVSVHQSSSVPLARLRRMVPIRSMTGPSRPLTSLGMADEWHTRSIRDVTKWPHRPMRHVMDVSRGFVVFGVCA